METNDQNEILNHCRIHQFLNKATEKLHQIFLNRWKTYKNLESQAEENEWQNTPQYGAMLVSLCSGVPTKMADILKNEKLDLWDVTLTNYAIQAVSKAIKSYGGSNDKDEDKLVSDLRKIRNSVAHGKIKLTDNEFLMYSNQLTNILIRAGDNPSDIDEFKKSLMEFGQQKLPEVVVDEKSKFVQLKEEANKFFKANKFNEAIEKYNLILDISGLSSLNQAMVYSNRSAAYLMVKTPNSLLMAKRDAEWTIQLWPCWWKGYYRLGRALREIGELNEAQESLNKAFALNPESKEARDELSFVRSRIGAISRHDHLNPDIQPKSIEEVNKEVQTRLGIDEKDLEDIRKMSKNTPFADIVKGHQHRDGTGAAQDYGKAAAHYARAANNGIPEGMYNLAQLHFHGKGVKRDYDLSLHWLRKAANSKPLFNNMQGSGVSEAQHMLGLMYADGTGVNQDFKQAKEWYEKAVMNGLGASANNLGLMYKNGQGVEKSQTKAFYYFKLASERGDTPGMQNLALCYFNAEGTGSPFPTEADIDEGKKWLRIAADRGDILSAKMLEDREKFSKIDHQMASMMKIFSTDPSLKSNPLDQEQFGKAVKEAAKKGSKTAQRHLEIWDNLNAALEAFKKNDSAGVCSSLTKATRIDHQIFQVPDLFKSVIEERYKNHPNDLDAIICYISLNSKKMRLDIIFNQLEKFPSDEFLIEMLIIGCIGQRWWKEALKSADAAIKQFSNSIRFLYIRAIILALSDERTDELIQAFDKFLSVAPIDHDKVPACHYRKAQYYLLKKNDPKFMESAEAGLESEKKQLPCFLPYDFPQRDITEKMYYFMKSGGGKWNKNKGDMPPVVSPSSSIQNNILAIYNWPKVNDKIEVMKTFRPNTMISIINPYMRQASDGKNIIRLESPAYINLDNSLAEKKCYCCGKEAETLRCAKCLMARYCSKNCQKIDWIEFNHKEVCKYLKPYSSAVNS